MNLLLRAMICIATSRPIRWAASWNYRVETALIQQQVGWEPVEWADVRPWGPERRNAFGVVPAAGVQEDTRRDAGLVEASAAYLFADEIPRPSAVAEPRGELHSLGRLEQEQQPAEPAMSEAESDFAAASAKHACGRARLRDRAGVHGWHERVRHGWNHLRARFRQRLQQLVKLLRRERLRR